MVVIVVLDSNQNFQILSLFEGLSMHKGELPFINNAFKHKNGTTRYTHIKVGRNKSYFISDPLNGDNKYTANDIYKMIEFLMDNIYVRFGGQLF